MALTPRLVQAACDRSERTRSRIRQTEASHDEADARYAQTLLAALQDASNVLSYYGHPRESVVRLQPIDASADRSATLMRQRDDAGVSSLTDLLDTQRT